MSICLSLWRRGGETVVLTCDTLLSLRTDSPDAAVRSRPQREIEMGAEKMEIEFAHLMPITYASFVKNGRIAP